MTEPLDYASDEWGPTWVEKQAFRLHPINRATRLYWEPRWYWIVGRGHDVSNVDGKHLALVCDDGGPEKVLRLRYNLALAWYRAPDKEFEFFDEDDNPLDPIVVNRYGEQQSD